jgi:phage tail-like protein
MQGATGFFHLNLANEWAEFDVSDPNLTMASDGALMLARTSGNVIATRGVFRGGPFAVPDDATSWYRLQAYAEPLHDGTHIQLFTLTTAADSIGTFDAGAEEPFPQAAGWQATPPDVLDMIIPNPPEPPAPFLWIGGVLRSDGQASPGIRQIRVDYGRATYLTFLPAIYGKDVSRREFLERFLSLHESVLGGLEGAIADLPRLFDPFAAPNGELPSWLAWLAGWLAFDLNDAWSEAETRQYLAQAFRLYGQRGTVAGLRRYLKLYAGVEARIDEPGLQTALWSLGETSILGFTTMLAPAHLQGAVVGTSATLGQSHLTRGDDLGSVLFEDVAHQFCVQVYCAELTRPGALADVQAVLERERPAHTIYHLCVIEPRMRVGVQARVGIDAIVAQGPPTAHTGMVLGMGRLAAEAEPCEIEEET